VNEWQLDPGVLAGAGVALAFFAQGWLRLRRRSRAGWDRAALFCLGIAVATLALVSPLHEIGEASLLSAHMLQHVELGDIAPALLVVALRGPLTFFFLPAALLRRLARLCPLRRALSLLLRPRVGFGVWALTLGLWHVPAAYDYALTHPLAHELEHVSFMTGGLLVWAQLVDPALGDAHLEQGAPEAHQHVGRIAQCDPLLDRRVDVRDAPPDLDHVDQVTGLGQQRLQRRGGHALVEYVREPATSGFPITVR